MTIEFAVVKTKTTKPICYRLTISGFLKNKRISCPSMKGTEEPFHEQEHSDFVDNNEQNWKEENRLAETGNSWRREQYFRLHHKVTKANDERRLGMSIR